MPGGDRTGPIGYGPMTGRAAGFCAGYDRPGYANPGPGRGFGWGGGGRGRGGRGWRHRYYATGMPGWMRSGWGPVPPSVPNAGSEKEFLETQRQALQAQLDHVKARLDELAAPVESQKPD